MKWKVYRVKFEIKTVNIHVKRLRFIIYGNCSLTVFQSTWVQIKNSSKVPAGI